MNERRIFNWFADLGEKLPGFRNNESRKNPAIERRDVIDNLDLADKATGQDNHPKPTNDSLPIESSQDHATNFPYER